MLLFKWTTLVELLHDTTYLSGFYKKMLLLLLTFSLVTLQQEPGSVTTFDLFTFFFTDLIQSEASWKLHVLNFWLVNVYMKEYEFIKRGHAFGLIAVVKG